MRRLGLRLVLVAAVAASGLAGAVPGGAVTEVGPDGSFLGGNEVEPGTYPFMTALVSAGEEDAYASQYCGGTLIDPRWVLTAAHCAEGDGPDDLEVIIGRTDLRSDDGERLSVSEIHIHPSYDDWTTWYDAALLRLDEPSRAAPTTLARAGARYDQGTMATVMGWGDTLMSPRFPWVLNEVGVPLVSDEACAAYYGSEFASSSMICAGGFFGAGTADACAGDSGGPLLVRDGDGWVQVGIVSWGDECSVGESPGVYARVSALAPWIADVTGGIASARPPSGGRQSGRPPVNPPGGDGPEDACAGIPATIIGTEGSEVLVGTAGSDVIAAGGGDDVVWAGGGDDVVCGGSGDDEVLGERGRDRIFGGAGDDTLDGGAGDDTLYGDAGSDHLNGGDGYDLLFGGAGDDHIVGGPGDDRLLGEAGIDTGFGGAGTDTCELERFQACER